LKFLVRWCSFPFIFSEDRYGIFIGSVRLFFFVSPTCLMWTMGTFPSLFCSFFHTETLRFVPPMIANLSVPFSEDAAIELPAVQSPVRPLSSSCLPFLCVVLDLLHFFPAVLNPFPAVKKYLPLPGESILFLRPYVSPIRSFIPPYLVVFSVSSLRGFLLGILVRH